MADTRLCHHLWQPRVQFIVIKYRVGDDTLSEPFFGILVMTIFKLSSCAAKSG